MPVIGLKDLYWAPMKTDSTGGETYEKPEKLAPAVSATVTPNYSITTQYGDDRAVAVAGALGDIDIELSVTDLSSDQYALLLGTKKNSDGVVEEKVDDKPPYGALGFRLPKENGEYKYYWYYKGRFQPTGGESTTQQAEVSFQNQTLTGKFLARDDGKWRAHCESDDDKLGSDVAKTWFDSVYEPSTSGSGDGSGA